MIRRPHSKRNFSVLMCAIPSCNNVSCDLNLIEQRVLNGLAEWLSAYRLEWNLDAPQDNSHLELMRRTAKRLENDLDKLDKQLDTIHDLLEQGVYTTDKFLERSRLLTDKIQTTKADIAKMNENIADEVAKAKNDMLKEILEKIVYTKESRGTKANRDNFEIVLFPKLPGPSEVFSE